MALLCYNAIDLFTCFPVFRLFIPWVCAYSKSNKARMFLWIKFAFYYRKNIKFINIKSIFLYTNSSHAGESLKYYLHPNCTMIKYSLLLSTNPTTILLLYIHAESIINIISMMQHFISSIKAKIYTGKRWKGRKNRWKKLKSLTTKKVKLCVCMMMKMLRFESENLFFVIQRVIFILKLAFHALSASVWGI